MKIGFLSDLWVAFPGGAERYASNVSQALIDRGHEVYVLTSYAPAKNRNCTTLTIKDIGVNDRVAEGRQTIIDWVEEIDPDILISHHYFVGVFGDLLTSFVKSVGIPFIEIIHNRPRHPDAAFAIFNSEFTAARCGYREGDMVMLPPVTDECVAPQNFFNGLRYKDQVYIGHIKPLGGKGIALTYRLAEEMPDRQFLILRGEWQDGEVIRRDLLNVEYMEPVDDIREFYARCRIVLMPSLSEDAGTVPQECALNGIPCISSDAGGLPETNKGGIIFSSDDLDAWRDMIYVLDNPKVYQKVADEQRQYVDSLHFPARFDEISERVRALCAT